MVLGLMATKMYKNKNYRLGVTAFVLFDLCF